MSKPYILVVDDEPAIRDLVKEILDDEGYEVATADGGDAARQAMRNRRPDLALLDIWMPDLDGISLLKEWSRDGGLPCPVIMISGHGTVETAVEATRLGGVGGHLDLVALVAEDLPQRLADVRLVVHDEDLG